MQPLPEDWAVGTLTASDAPGEGGQVFRPVFWNDPHLKGRLCSQIRTNNKDNPQITGVRVCGTVKYQGKIVTGGEIRLVSADDPNKSMSSRIDGDGAFDMPNAPTGKCKVVVDTNMAKSDLSVLAAKSGGAVDPSTYGKPVKYMKIDDRYASEMDTTYTVTIERGDQQVTIDLP